MVKVKTQVDIKKNTIKDELKSEHTIKEALNELLRSVEESRSKVKKAIDSFQSEKIEHESNVEILKKQEDLLNSLTLGVNSKGENHGFVAQLQSMTVTIR